ncbi:MAG: hypothetical protein A4E27_00348 [Methanobacterium sp. PtaU1.Bin242]|nr:MAG: hypothetical protein A4E27_00348 [Methanobacterium sp. PtaU1.Bin242]
MDRRAAILIGILTSIIIFISVFSRLIGDISYYLLFFAPLIGGLIASYLFKGGYREGMVNGAISTIPFATLMVVLAFLILNLDSEDLFTAIMASDLLTITVPVLIFSIFILIGVLGGLIGVFVHKKLN